MGIGGTEGTHTRDPRVLGSMHECAEVNMGVTGTRALSCLHPHTTDMPCAQPNACKHASPHTHAHTHTPGKRFVSRLAPILQVTCAVLVLAQSEVTCVRAADHGSCRGS